MTLGQVGLYIILGVAGVGMLYCLTFVVSRAWHHGRWETFKRFLGRKHE